MDPKAAKERLRNAIKERLSKMTSGDKAAEGRSVSRRIIDALPKEPVAIALYVPMPSEVDISLLLTHLFKHGYPVYLPRGEKHGFTYRLAESMEVLTKGERFGVPEPSDDAPILDPTDLAIAIVPARAYNKFGHRLGRGNGGYDIWIATQRKANPKTRFWGVCLDCQLVREIPMEAHDATVDAVVTPRELMEAQVSA
jgi:5-formyltetrahydrofolate cyclo-ligase